MMKKLTYDNNLESIFLVENIVHIWIFNLDEINPVSKQALKEILSRDELNRAAKFRFDNDRQKFICGSGLLRVLISLYINISPKNISFNYNKHGKPELSKEQKESKLHFNMSHSENMLCIGFVKNEPIGVDIEVIKQINDYLEIANNFFSESEITQLKSFPIEKALEGFYNCWTGKEAFIKLSGEGLSYPLKDFDVQIKEMKVDETNRYNILIKKNEEIFIVESFKLQDNLVGSCALRNKSYNTTYCFFENNVYSINSFITENLSSND